MKRFGLFLGALTLLALPPAIAARAVPPSAPKAATSQAAAAPEEANGNSSEAQVQAIQARLHPQTGDIRIPEANVVLHLGQNYYFLPANEARIVLTEGWGNPPDAVDNVLGIVFPAGKTFADDTWGAVITYNPSGYVSDTDSQSADYDELLQQLQAGEAELNQRYAAQGYPAQHLVGWAQPPAYDRNTHSVVWARNLQITGARENTLNYDLRLLGRNGVLSLNMVTVMSQLAQTREAAQRFAAQVEFTPGNRYADHQSGDRTAEYGVAGLVAAGVGVAVAQKAGVIAIVLLFLKKVGVFIIAGLALLGGWLRRVFSRRRDALEGAAYHETPPEAQPATAPLATDVPAAEGEAPPPQPNG
jgi:uncharacterized membrane-anchored protein